MIKNIIRIISNILYKNIDKQIKEEYPDVDLQTVKNDVYNVIFNYDTKRGQKFDLILLFLIFLSVLCIIFHSVDPFPAYMTIEWIFTILFTIEYGVRIWCNKNAKRYIFSFWGIIDFLAIIPTYLLFFNFATDYLHYIIVLRILRVVRIVSIMHVFAYTKAAYIMQKGLRNSFPKVLVFLLYVLIFVTMSGTLMYVVEGVLSDNPNPDFDNIPESIYWAIVTVTTVGYGDIVPQSIGGRVISSIMMLVGYALIAVPTGIVASEITKGNLKSER